MNSDKHFVVEVYETSNGREYHIAEKKSGCVHAVVYNATMASIVCDTFNKTSWI